MEGYGDRGEGRTRRYDGTEGQGDMMGREDREIRWDGKTWRYDGTEKHGDMMGRKDMEI